MKAVRIHRHGGREVLAIDDLPEPASPRAGEVSIEVKATSLNRLDLWMRNGIPGFKLALPHILGCDAAGIVHSAGEGVTWPPPGERVVLNPGLGCGRCEWCLGGETSLCPDYAILGEHAPGTMAELVTVPARNCHRLPTGLDFVQAAALPLVFLTAWRMLVTRAKLRPGDDVLVLGASGGVGTALVQIARHAGARVIAVTASAEKAKRLRELGVHETIEAGLDTFHKDVRTLTAGRGVDVIADSVGAAAWGSSLKSLTRGGRLVTCGATSGFEAATDLRHVFFRQLEILGSTMGSGRELHEALRLVERGALRPVVDSTYSFAAIRDAHERLESRAVFGKVVVTP